MARTFLSILVVVTLLLGFPLASANADQLNLALPQSDWAVQLQLNGFEVDYQEFLPDLTGRSFQAHDSISGLVVSVLIEPVGEFENAVQYRDRWLDNLKQQRAFEINALRVFETGDAACFEYIATLPDGPPEFDQKNVFVCRRRDSTSIAIHLSKVQAQPEDQKLFDDFLANVQVVESHFPSAIERYVFGSRYAASGRFDRSAEELSAALNLDRVDYSLSEPILIDLIDRLSHAYAMTGDAVKRRETLEYGVARFPDDPSFHYDLARVYAEAGDLERTLTHLTFAHDLNKAAGSEADFPDPRKDPAFVQFRDNERFETLCDGFGIVSTSRTFSFTLPDLGSALEFSLDNAEVELNSLGTDLEKRTFQARDKLSGLLVSVFIAEEEKRGGLAKLQEFIREGAERRSYGDSLLDVETNTRDSTAYLSYAQVDLASGDASEVSHLWVMTVRGKMWLTVHLSLREPQPVARVIFDDLLANLVIKDGYTLSSLDDFKFGSHYYQLGKYNKACKFYEAGVELEKQKRSLPHDIWLVLVDNLGMSYGLGGKPKKAQDVFEYGISEVPDYPMFHYNLACAHAERRDFDQALLSLEEAFKYKANMIEGETLPDPREDPSFKRLKNDDRLLGLIKRYSDNP